MASTGLLTGVNPYRGGNVAIDFVSKPTEYLIKELQHQKAKAEATDKYFMDWEKSLNPAGLGKDELNVFTQKLKAAKEYAIKNKEQINNPSKYGYDANSNLTALFKDAQTYIDQGKQKAANIKAFKTILDKARMEGKNIDGDIEVWADAQKPVGQGYVDPDIARIRIYDPYDSYKYQKELKTLNTIPGKPELIKEGNYQYSRTPLEADLNNVKSFAYNKLNDLGYVKMLNNLSDAELNELDKVYQSKTKTKLPKNDIKEISLAHTLSNLPKDYTQTNLVEQPSYTRAQQDAYIRNRKDQDGGGVYSPEVQVDEIFEAGSGDKISINIEGKNISGRRVQLPADIEGKFDRKIGNKKFSPDYFVMSEDKLNVYPVFVTGKTKSGSDIIGGEDGTRLNEKIPVKTSLVPALGKAYGGQSWTRKNLFSDGKAPATAPPKTETWAERQARLKKKK